MEKLTTTLRKEISGLRAELLTELRKSQAALDDHDTRITALETALTDMSSSLQKTEHQCNSLVALNQLLRQKTDDLENRPRRMNLRIIGIPEGAEQGRPTDFMSSFFTALFGKDKLPRAPVIDRAHRSLMPKLAPGRHPRAMIFCFHHFQIKEEIIKLSPSEYAQMNFQGSPIRIFPDLSAELARRRAEFKDVKAQFYNAGIRFHHMYPSRLLVRFQDKDHGFDDPTKAALFFKDMVHPSLTLK